MTKGRILLVDDSATIRALYAHLLRRGGYEVLVAKDGAEALELLGAQRSLHLIISDLQMPGICGLELVNTIRTLPKFQRLPILMLTQSEDREDLMRNLEAGVSDYVLKSCEVFEFMARVGNLTRVGLYQEELERISQTDLLTGAFNRRHAMVRLQEELSRSRRYGQPFTVALFDIDHFKTFNDTWGHKAGDDVLVELTKLVQRSSRDCDCLVRWGGEEFLLLLPSTGLDAARGFIERLLERIRTHSFRIGAEQVEVTVTVSAGVAGLVDQDTIDSLIHRADQGLYQAKENGRDQVALVPPDWMKTLESEQHVA